MELIQKQLEFIDTIFETATLSREKIEKLKNHFISWINTSEYNLDLSYGGIYRYATNLILKEERGVDPLNSALSLDASFANSSFNLLNSILTANLNRYNLNEASINKNPVTNDSSPNIVKGADLYKFLDGIKDRLDYYEYKLMDILISHCSAAAKKLPMMLDNALPNIPQLKERLEKMVKKFKINDQIVIPRKHIIEISFEPYFTIKSKRRDFEGNPLKFFNENIETYGQLSRSQLEVVDQTLYVALLKHRQIDMAIRQKRGITYRGYESPLDYFNAHPELHNLRAKELKKIDGSLYRYLSKSGQIQKAIPKRYRGYNNALDYFNAHPELHSLSRKGLYNGDAGLYDKLRAESNLQIAIPKKYRGYDTALEYFNAHPELHNLSRKKLSSQDGGLYKKLEKEGNLQIAISKISNSKCLEVQ